MITLTKIQPSEISTDVLDRLYSEAYARISIERKRMGDDALRAALIDDLQDYPIIRYDVDGYTVGICSYSELVYEGKTYLYHRHPIYGQTQTGSRAWWYSEEFQQKNSEFVRNEGYAGVITLFNPDSPAGQAVAKHFGSFGKYYNTPVIFDNPRDLGLYLDVNARGVLKAFLISLRD